MDENEGKVQTLRTKRLTATIELNELVKGRNKAVSAVKRWNQKVQVQAQKIRSYSAQIGMIRTGEKKGKVTDHAIVRYLERYKDFDIESIANEILEHPDAKFNDSGLVSTVFEDEAPMSKEASDILRLAKLKKII